MAGKVRNIYAEGNTARGFHDFFSSVFHGLDRLYVITGGPGTGKSTLVKTIGDQFVSRGHAVEWIHCPFDNGAVDGVILTEINIGLIDGTPPRQIDSAALGVPVEYVDLHAATDSHKLQREEERIEALHSEISDVYQKAYSTFAEALSIHDEWEKIYIANMDYAKANKVTEELAERLFEDRTLAKPAKVRHMFFGAATPKGAVDYIQDLTADVAKRYFIKGRPGSGKSTMLKNLAAIAEEKGFDVEVYHCGFDPNSLDMLLLPERSIAIFDSTAPHEYFPSRYTDEIIDMYARAIAAGTDEKHAAELAGIQARYSGRMKEATSYLAEGKALHDELVAIYKAATDYKKVESVTQDVLSAILKQAKENPPDHN
jgi:energy-coupling factor transporter ATP-binding protein EcfA2